MAGNGLFSYLFCTILIMHTHSISSPEKSRASAEGHKGSGASLPAAQLYKVQNIQQQNHRVSDNDNMAIRSIARPNRFFANDDAEIAPNILDTANGGPLGMNTYTSNVDFDNDCGGYANNILRKMNAVNTGTHTTYKRTQNAVQQIEVPFNVIPMFNQALSRTAAPDMGEIYMAVNDPADLVQNPTHYNFHWAVVVAQDGNDVITLESDSTANQGWFFMYNHYTQGQTFRYRYVFTLGMLSDAATVYELTYHQRLRVQQPQQAQVIPDDDDVIILD
jgi:hypothetical protein